MNFLVTSNTLGGIVAERTTCVSWGRSWKTSWI